jgi:hypothetical protein
MLSITNNSQGEEDKGFARTLCGATAGGTESGTPLFSGDFRHPLLRSLKLLVIDSIRHAGIDPDTLAPIGPPSEGALVRFTLNCFGVSVLRALGSSACARRSIPPKRCDTMVQ